MTDENDEGLRRELARWTHAWLVAAELQAGRVSRAAGLNEREPELLLFVDAVRNVLRGGRAVLGDDHPSVQQLDRDNAVRNVRDMLEHFNEYVLGTGKLQSRDDPRWDLMWTGSGDEHSIQFEMVNKSGERTRHRLDSQQVAREARALVDTVLREVGLDSADSPFSAEPEE